VQVIFTVNGPGEISGWLFPLSTELRARHPGVRIVACLLPCVFASGSERRVIERLGVADAVLDQRESLRLIRRPSGHSAVRRDLPTIVFHLGGEPTLTVLLARRLRAPLLGYAERPLPFARQFRRIFYSGLEQLPEAVARDAGAVVGELMVDAARLRRERAVSQRTGRVTVALYPGSRAWMAEGLLPFYAATVERIARDHPEVDWVVARSDFLSSEVFDRLGERPEGASWEVVAMRHDAVAARLVTPAGVELRLLPGAEALGRADLALTIPGTNTGELAAAGVPMVVVLPTDVGHKVPLPGLAGHLGRLPGVGRALKTAMGHRLLRSLPLLSIPNRRAGTMIVPELVGRDLQGRMEAALRSLLAADRADIGKRLRAAMGAPGADRRLADAIGAELRAAGA
jgi:lipid-A-disaccharide synthase